MTLKYIFYVIIYNIKEINYYYDHTEKIGFIDKIFSRVPEIQPELIHF